MVKFSAKDFSKIDIDSEGVKQLLSNAKRDITIAKKSTITEVVFDFSYKGLIKTGISLFAHYGYRVSSMAGHHIKIIKKMGEILKDDTVDTIGNVMRSKRNQDFYGGGVFISQKETKEYLTFVNKCLSKINKLLKTDK